MVHLPLEERLHDYIEDGTLKYTLTMTMGDRFVHALLELYDYFMEDWWDANLS